MSDHPKPTKSLKILQDADVVLERDGFLRNLLRELSGTLQDIVGLDEAAGFISVVGQKIGEQINQLYIEELGVEQLDSEQVGAVLVDLKRRIRGDFSIVSADEDRIVLENRACPFEDKVIGRPALCMMTSNVFGVIAAQNLGYAKVDIEEAIARGDSGCRVVVHLHKTEDARGAEGREYYRA